MRCRPVTEAAAAALKQNEDPRQTDLYRLWLHGAFFPTSLHRPDQRGVQGRLPRVGARCNLPRQCGSGLIVSGPQGVVAEPHDHVRMARVPVAGRPERASLPMPVPVLSDMPGVINDLRVSRGAAGPGRRGGEAPKVRHPVFPRRLRSQYWRGLTALLFLIRNELRSFRRRMAELPAAGLAGRGGEEVCLTGTD